MLGLSLISWLAVAVIVAALVAAFTKRFLATGLLILANIAVFLLTQFGPQVEGILGGPAGGLRPMIQGQLALWEPNLLHGTALGVLQLFTGLFVHGSLLHLGGNMLFLFAFGIPFEERIGHRKFLGIYLATGVFASLVQTGLDLSDPHLAMGASGAIAGIMGAFAARYPHQVVMLPVPLVFFIRIMPLRVLTGAAIWVGFQVIDVLMQTMAAAPDGVGYGAHFGGLAAGLFVGRFLLKPGATGPIAVDLKALAPFARDPTTRQVLAHMNSNHDEPAVFQAWLDRFFRTASCPTCGQRVSPKPRGEVVCEANHRFDVRQGIRTAPPPA